MFALLLQYVPRTAILSQLYRLFSMHHCWDQHFTICGYMLAPGMPISSTPSHWSGAWLYLYCLPTPYMQSFGMRGKMNGLKGKEKRCDRCSLQYMGLSGVKLPSPEPAKLRKDCLQRLLYIPQTQSTTGSRPFLVIMSTTAQPAHASSSMRES